MNKASKSEVQAFAEELVRPVVAELRADVAKATEASEAASRAAQDALQTVKELQRKTNNALIAMAEAERRVRQEHSRVKNADAMLQAAQDELWATLRHQQAMLKAAIDAHQDQALEDVYKAGNSVRALSFETRTELERLIRRAGVELKLKGGKRG